MALISKYIITDQQLLWNMLQLIEALRSGKFTQIAGHLCGEGNDRCAIGVMCELATEIGKFSEKITDDGMRYFEHQFEPPENCNDYIQAPQEVFDHYGFQLATHYDTECPAVYYFGEMCSIAYLNDSLKFSFSVLADLLEQTYVKGIEIDIDDDEDPDEYQPQAAIVAAPIC